MVKKVMVFLDQSKFCSLRTGSTTPGDSLRAVVVLSTEEIPALSMLLYSV